MVVGIEPELAGPRPARGLHCYDVALEETELAEREDALVFRQMNAVATATQCAFSATSHFPESIPAAEVLGEQQRDDPACRVRDFLAQPRQDIAYASVDDSTIRLCAVFNRSYGAYDAPARVFDPRRDARFAELAEVRPETGRRCYSIRMLLPDPITEAPASPWDEPMDLEVLPMSMRSAAIQDRSAIGDAVNVLRLARCAFTVNGALPSTFEEAVQVIVRRPHVAERYNCEWAPNYFGDARNSPTATYERLDGSRVQVCTLFQKAWERPLELSYYGEALREWPTSLPELQRSISVPGRHCFTVLLTAIGSGVT